MPVGEENTRKTVISFLDRQGLVYERSEERHCDKLTVRRGTLVAYVQVYKTGKIVVQGKTSPLSELLEKMKTSLETDGTLPGEVLPFELDNLPQTARERVPECDEVVVTFLEEAVRCLRADALLGAAFMLGAASERAVSLLISSYAESIADESNRNSFLSRVNGRMISTKYDEFLRSYKSCKSKPTDPALSHDLETIIGQMFQFCRVTRNEVGHPDVVPDLDKGSILASMSYFPTYLSRLYGLMAHFRTNGVTV